MEEIKALLRDVLKEDHDILVKVGLQLDLLLRQQGDHERRIRVLERGLCYGIGAVAAIKLAVDLLNK